MSWIFGFYSKKNIDTKFISKYHPPSIESICNNTYYIAIGGNKHNLLYDKHNPKIKYFMCGFPILNLPLRLLGKDDLDNIINSSLDSIEMLNGHFCGVLLKDESISFFTDKLGLREFHIYENETGWYFSTRLDWLLKVNHFEINFEEFGSRWKLINQLSNKSIVKNIQRINSGLKTRIDRNRIEVAERNWFPQKSNDISVKDFIDILRENIFIGKYNSSKISLSLSGGMDSRVILSFLLSGNYENWDCHTFDSDSKMDSTIAEIISQDFNIRHKMLSSTYYSEDIILSELDDYIGVTYLAESGFISRKLMHYKSLPKDSLIIDGGFGEIWRREFLTRLYHFGKNDILNKNIQNISRYLIHHRADIFNEDCNTTMQNGIYNQIRAIFIDLPPVKEIGLSNWLDLFSLKTRLSNYYGPEQGRIDDYVKSYMPFVQPNLLENLLNVSVNIRKDNRLFKKIIKSNQSKLSKYNLAKGNMSYPFWLTPIMKRIFFQVHNKIIGSDDNHTIDLYLNNLKEFALDIVSSKSVKEYSPYNYNFINNTMISYYKGNTELRKIVDWFITFEIFRQKL